MSSSRALAPRSKPPKKKRRRKEAGPRVTARMAARMVALAASRDGDNSILLDLADAVGTMSGRVETLIQDRATAAGDRQALNSKLDDLSRRLGNVEQIVPVVAKIEPVVWKLEERRVEQVGAKKFIGGVVTKARVGWALGGGLVAAGLHALLGWPKPPSG